MTTHGVNKSSLLIGACVAMFCLPAFSSPGKGTPPTASDTSSGSASSTNSAPSYDTDPRFGLLPNEDYTTPEADGRPGVYFFKIAARALEKKQYRYAIDMYKVSASWAYKPAEYNLGVMYFRGQGVPVDRSLGAAWMVLAAERNTPKYMQARDLMITQLSNTEFSRTNELWGQLKPTYGDEVALHRAEVRWAYVRTHITGSRTGGTTGPLRIGSAGGGKHAPSAPPGTAGAALAQVDKSAADILGAHNMDGTIAYAQFRQSNNPYDPKFENDPTGTTSIGPLTPVNGKPTPDKTDAGSGSQ